MEVVENEINWFAFRTKSRAEKKVHERLLDAGLNSFLPLRTEIRLWSDRKKKVIVPLISSFVFINCSKKDFRKILEIQGVVCVLKLLSKPAIIKDEEIENLRILISNIDLTKLEYTDKIFTGDYIEVIKGPLKGMSGLSVLIKGNHRVLIEISALENKMLVDIPLSFVNKIS